STLVQGGGALVEADEGAANAAVAGDPLVRICDAGGVDVSSAPAVVVTAVVVVAVAALVTPVDEEVDGAAAVLGPAPSAEGCAPAVAAADSAPSVSRSSSVGNGGRSATSNPRGTS